MASRNRQGPCPRACTLRSGSATSRLPITHRCRNRLQVPRGEVVGTGDVRSDPADVGRGSLIRPVGGWSRSPGRGCRPSCCCRVGLVVAALALAWVLRLMLLGAPPAQRRPRLCPPRSAGDPAPSPDLRSCVRRYPLSQYAVDTCSKGGSPDARIRGVSGRPSPWGTRTRSGSPAGVVGG
jgi:hypothetical protein